MAATPKSKTKTSHFEFGPWKLTATESHILKSEGEDREKYVYYTKEFSDDEQHEFMQNFKQ